MIPNPEIWHRDKLTGIPYKRRFVKNPKNPIFPKPKPPVTTGQHAHAPQHFSPAPLLRAAPRIAPPQPIHTAERVPTPQHSTAYETLRRDHAAAAMQFPPHAPQVPATLPKQGPSGVLRTASPDVSFHNACWNTTGTKTQPWQNALEYETPRALFRHEYRDNIGETCRISDEDFGEDFGEDSGEDSDEDSDGHYINTAKDTDRYSGAVFRFNSTPSKTFPALDDMSDDVEELPWSSRDSDVRGASQVAALSQDDQQYWQEGTFTAPVGQSLQKGTMPYVTPSRPAAASLPITPRSQRRSSPKASPPIDPALRAGRISRPISFQQRVVYPSPSTTNRSRFLRRYRHLNTPEVKRPRPPSLDGSLLVDTGNAPPPGSLHAVDTECAVVHDEPIESPSTTPRVAQPSLEGPCDSPTTNPTSTQLPQQTGIRRSQRRLHSPTTQPSAPPAGVASGRPAKSPAAHRYATR